MSSKGAVYIEGEVSSPRRNNFLLGLHAELLFRVVNSEMELKINDYLLNDLPSMWMWFVPSARIFLAKEVYMVQRSSLYLDLPTSQLERS